MNFRLSLSIGSIPSGLPAYEYAIKVESDKILLYQASSGGLLSIPILGEITINSVSEQGGWLGEGSSVIMVDDTDNRTVRHELSIVDTGAKLDITVTYNTDQIVDEIGVEAEILRQIGIEKDSDIHVGGDAVLVEESGPRLRIFIDKGSEQAHQVFLADGTPTLAKGQERQEGETRKASITFLRKDCCPVRVLCQPNGCEATFTSIIHADSQTVESVKAVVYGSSDSSHPDYMQKGMVANGLVATWTTFCDGIGINNPEMLDLLLQMQSDGFEIAPHSIFAGNDDRADAVEWLPILASHFDCRNWVDHSLGDGARTLGLASLGWNPAESEYYIMDLLDSHGYEYAWSYQDINSINRGMVPPTRYNFPRWILYRNPNIQLPSERSFWLYKNSPYAMSFLLEKTDPSAIVDEWISQCNVVIDHDYYGTPSYNGKTFVAGTPYLTTTKFNEICQYIGEQKAQGKLWNPTASQFFDYFRKIANIDVSIVSQNTYRVINNSGETVNCSFLVGNKWNVTPELDGEPINAKNTTKGTICWADVPPGESIMTLLLI